MTTDRQFDRNCLYIALSRRTTIVFERPGRDESADTPIRLATR